MTEEPIGSPPAAAADQPAGEFDRLVGVLFDPKATFPGIAARPVRWWVPLLLLMALAVGFTYAYTQRVGWEGFMRQQIEQSSRTQNLSPEQKEEIIAQQVQFAPVIGYVFGLLGWPFIVLVVTAVFLFVLNVLLGAQLTFRPVFTVTAYSMLPNFVGGVVALVVLFLKEPSDFDLQNPLASNIGAFLDPNSVPAWLVSLASSLDVFIIWTLLLLATGYSTAARRLAWGKAFTWVVATWVVFLVVKSAWIWIWS